MKITRNLKTKENRDFWDNIDKASEEVKSQNLDKKWLYTNYSTTRREK